MPASTMTNQPPSGRRFRSTTVGDEDAGRTDDPAAGLEHEREARARARRGRIASRVVVRRQRRSGPARTRCRGRRRDRDARARTPVAARARARVGDGRRAARASGSVCVICDPMCTCRPTTLRGPGAATMSRDHRARVGDRHAELRRARAGGDVRMAAGVDVRIDAHGDARARAVRRARSPSMRSTSPGDSALIARDAERRSRASSSARVLPTPVKTMSPGAKPARSATSISPPEFASAPAPSARRRRTTRERRVGLDGVVQPMRIAGEGARRARGSARR